MLLSLEDILNNLLKDLVSNWKEMGSPGQEGFYWSKYRQNWINAFPEDENFILSIPDYLDRGKVHQLCKSREYSVREKFLSVMLWGYGDRGYGPYRVTQMLSQENAIDILSEVYNLCASGKPKEAYKFLTQNRIKLLGPSYGSKFMAFCVPRQIGAPIFDSYISIWINEFAIEEFKGIKMTSETWSSKIYDAYWDWIKYHANKLECYPDDIELIIFRDAENKFSKSSIWQGK